MQHKINLLKRDITVNAISRCGKFRVTAVSAPNILKETVRRHNLTNSSGSFKWDPKIAIPLLGQVISFSNLTASWLSHEERVKTAFSTVQNGTFIAQSLALGETVSFVRNRPVKVESEGDEEAYEYEEDLLHSNGVLKIERIMYRQTTPVLSATKWIPSAQEQDVLFCDKLNDENLNNNLAPHVMNYFGRSDGVPTAAFFFCHYDENKLDQVYNGGVLIQAVAASAAEVEDPKNDFDDDREKGSADSSTATSTTKKLTAERDLENFILNRCDFFNRLSVTVDHEKQVVNYNNQEHGGDISSVFMNQLHRRATQGLLLQDLLGMATNDWNGSAKVCSKARHLTQKDLEMDTSVEWDSCTVTTPELATLAQKCFEETTKDIDAKKEKYHQSGNQEQQQQDDQNDQKSSIKRVRLDAETTKRTSIDFFCRCQRDKGFEKYLKSMKTSETAIQFMKENLPFDESKKQYKFQCASCMTESGLSEEYVMKMFIESDNDGDQNKSNHPGIKNE